MTAGLCGWHDANDKLLADDFTGLGRSQLMFMNVDGAGGSFYVTAVDGGVNSQLQSLAVVPWSPALITSLAGWMDAADKLVRGNFTGDLTGGLAGAQGAASVRQCDGATNSFLVVNTAPSNKAVGSNSAICQLASAKTLTGDFLGLNKDQYQ